MRGIQCADIALETFTSVSALPAEAAALLDEAGSLFAARVWWSVVLSEAMPASAEALFVTCRSGNRVLGLIPMLRHFGSGRLGSLTTPYSCRYTPLLAIGLDATTRVSVMAVFAGFCRTAGVTRIEALPAEWDGLSALMAGAYQAGLRPLLFNHFGNWHEDVSGLDWAAYLARRPGGLRETIRRRLRQAEKLPEARFALMTAPADMEEAAETFESVYARSWKVAEPYPRFNVALMRGMAEVGLLRFAVWSLGTTPIAVQIWLMEAGHATVLKLAHDEAFKTHSPGTVLTAMVLRHLLDHEHVRHIDFGRGDDAYKQGWAVQRRQRVGLLLVNPWRPSGMVELVRHALGRLRAASRAGALGPNHGQPDRAVG